MWEAISPYLSAVVLIGGAVAVVAKWIAPAVKLSATVKDLIKRVERLEEHDKKDMAVLEDFDRRMKAQNRAMLSVVNHMIDGNGVDKLRESRDELTDLLLK